MKTETSFQENKTKRFHTYAWMTLLRFGIAYLFFYNGRTAAPTDYLG